MELSIEGLVTAAFVFVVAACLRAPLIIGLPIAMAFGSTSLGAVKALGGSSPLISVLFVLILLGVGALRRSSLPNLISFLREQPIAWVVLAIGLYSLGSAMLLPRLFASQTTAFVPVAGIVVEVPLEPVSGNITQTGYLLLGILTYIALSTRLRDDKTFDRACKGLFAYVIANAALGVLDAIGKALGAGDVLKPIRSASYAMLTDVEQAGFARLVGGYSEASAFGAALLAGLAFCFVYWRKTGSKYVLALGLSLLLLTLLSTSSTSYVGLAALSIPVAISFIRSCLVGRVTMEDVGIAIAGVLACLAIVGLYLYNDHIMDPIFQLLDTTLLNKANSGSGQERAYWNMRSLASFMDTYGLGVGFGSSRASSWLVAVVSQTGVVGTALMVVILANLIRNDSPVSRRSNLAKTAAIAAAARASALSYLIAQSISGGSADPGLLFFYALAVVGAARSRMGDADAPAGQPERHIRLLSSRYGQPSYI